jgi:hypothetical protein
MSSSDRKDKELQTRLQIEAVRPFELRQRAFEFYDAYKALPPTAPPSWPRYFLLCHSIELALKAYLSRIRPERYTIKILKDNTQFGHKLSKLLRAAVDSEGLALGSHSRKELELLDKAHSKYWARYPKENSEPVYIIEQFEPSAKELLEQVSRRLTG